MNLKNKKAQAQSGVMEEIVEKLPWIVIFILLLVGVYFMLRNLLP